MDELLERESKWDVDEHFALPPLDDIGDVERETVGLTSTYYDTADGDLQSHGVLLRRRDGDDDTGWQLKVPDPDGRVEIRTGLSESPPPALANALLGMRLGKPLVTVATIRTTRDRYRITDPKDHRLCVEIDDDRVHASTEHRLLAWREIEVELGPAARSMPRLLADRLTESGARPSRHASKLAHVAAELRAPAAKAKRAKKSEKHYKRIQRVLGEHQDSVVASGTLRRLAITAGTTPGENGFTFGLLWAREQEAAEAARRRARTPRLSRRRYPMVRRHPSTTTLCPWNRRGMTEAHSGEDTDRDLVAELQRWQHTGAVWQVVSRSRRGVTVALLRCDGGEEVDRFSSDDPRLLAFIGDRMGSAE